MVLITGTAAPEKFISRLQHGFPWKVKIRNRKKGSLEC